LLNKFETEIEIDYKTKETNLYKIEFAIRLTQKNLSKIVVKYFDKEKTQNITTMRFIFYEDIFSLVDKIEVKTENNFTPKKTSLGEIVAAKYERPIEIEISKMERNNIN
jgi:hypothetical protein